MKNLARLEFKDAEEICTATAVNEALAGFEKEV